MSLFALSPFPVYNKPQLMFITGKCEGESLKKFKLQLSIKNTQQTLTLIFVNFT